MADCTPSTLLLFALTLFYSRAALSTILDGKYYRYVVFVREIGAHIDNLQVLEKLLVVEMNFSRWTLVFSGTPTKQLHTWM